MNQMSTMGGDEIKEASAFVYKLREEIGKVIVGQRYVVDRLLIGLLVERPRSARGRSRAWPRPWR